MQGCTSHVLFMAMRPTPSPVVRSEPFILFVSTIGIFAHENTPKVFGPSEFVCKPKMLLSPLGTTDLNGVKPDLIHSENYSSGHACAWTHTKAAMTYELKQEEMQPKPKPTLPRADYWHDNTKLIYLIYIQIELQWFTKSKHTRNLQFTPSLWKMTNCTLCFPHSC